MFFLSLFLCFIVAPKVISMREKVKVKLVIIMSFNGDRGGASIKHGKTGGRRGEKRDRIESLSPIFISLIIMSGSRNLCPSSSS